MRHDTGYRMTREAIAEFVQAQSGKGLAPGTVLRYRSSLERLYESLPEDRRIRAGTLERWREELLGQGFAPSSVNAFVSACNSFLRYAGRREYQLTRALPGEGSSPAPELTRGEYLRLLSTAKALGEERSYMLVMALANTGLHVSDLEKLTVEAVREGRLVTGSRNCRRVVRIAQCLRAELLAYARRSGVRAGPLFVTRGGNPMTRTGVASALSRLGRLAHLPEGKVTARALRRLWQREREDLEAGRELLVEQTLNRQMEEEQIAAAWGGRAVRAE